MAVAPLNATEGAFPLGDLGIVAVEGKAERFPPTPRELGGRQQDSLRCLVEA